MKHYVPRFLSSCRRTCSVFSLNELQWVLFIHRFGTLHMFQIHVWRTIEGPPWNHLPAVCSRLSEALDGTSGCVRRSYWTLPTYSMGGPIWVQFRVVPLAAKCFPIIGGFKLNDAFISRTSCKLEEAA